MGAESSLEIVLKRERLVVASALSGVTLICWVYLVVMVMAMEQMPESIAQAAGLAGVNAWTVVDFILMFLMWVIMMVGMMVPSAAPMILFFAMYNRKQKRAGKTYVGTAAFTAGYLVIWTGFSLCATLLQWMLDQAAMLSPMMVSTSPTLGAILLIGAGAFQVTPLKNACLAHCRSPLQFVMYHWRTGTIGAFRMGLEHGGFCMGCCWVLMGLLFFGGVMNLFWIAIIAIFVLLEKVAPHGPVAGKITGGILVLGGLYLIVTM